MSAGNCAIGWFMKLPLYALNPIVYLKKFCLGYNKISSKTPRISDDLISNI
jgi:hypothetical protein